MPIKKTADDDRDPALYGEYLKAMNSPRYMFLVEMLNQQMRAFHQRAPLPPPPDALFEGYAGFDEWLCLLIADHNVRARCIPHCFEPHTRYSIREEVIDLYLGNIWKVIDRAVDRLIEQGRVEEWSPDGPLSLPAQPAPQLKPAERFAILKRDSYRCRLCGASAREDNVTLHVDHITARKKGGDNDPLNLWTLCSVCNIGKGTQDL